ncbi:MAG: TolC family protein [Desulfarculus sp.]|nr:TolC family protein [Desulfarculus sp.]
MIKPLAIAAGLLLALAVPALAAPEPKAQSTDASSPPVEMLTLDQVRSLVLEKNRDIHKALEYKNYVQGRYVEERSAALPRFTISAHAYRQRDESQRALTGGLIPVQTDSFQGLVTLNQALYTWGQIGAAIRAAEVGILTADDQLRQMRQAALRDVTQAFHDVLLAKELNAIARQNLEQRQRHLDEAKRKFDAGTATDYDVLAAQVAVENARPDVIHTDNLIRTARERLGLLLARDGRTLDAQGKLMVNLSPPPAHDAVLARALEKRPELMSLKHQRMMAGELVTVYEAGDKPRLDFQGQYGRRDQAAGDNSEYGEMAMGGVFLTWPIFDGLKSRGKVSQAKSDERRLGIEQAQLMDKIGLEVTEALNAVGESAEIVRALSGTVEQATRLLDMAEKGYLYGVKTRLDVDDAQLNLRQAQGNLAKARRDYLVASVTLQWVAGDLGENETKP